MVDKILYIFNNSDVAKQISAVSSFAPFKTKCNNKFPSLLCQSFSIPNTINKFVGLRTQCTKTTPPARNSYAVI